MNLNKSQQILFKLNLKKKKKQKKSAWGENSSKAVGQKKWSNICIIQIQEGKLRKKMDRRNN